MTSPDPWQSSQVGVTPGPRPIGTEPPPVVLWAKIYTSLCAVMYLGVLGFGLFMLAAPDFLPNDEGETVLLIQGIFMTGLGLVLSILYAAPLFLQPSKGAWIFMLVLIGLTMTSCCFIPFGTPLLIYWLKPENKAYFRV